LASQTKYAPAPPPETNTGFEDAVCSHFYRGKSLDEIALLLGRDLLDVTKALEAGRHEWMLYRRWEVTYNRTGFAPSCGDRVRRPLARRPRNRGAGAPARRSTASRSTAGGDSGDSDLAGGDPPRPSAALAAASKRARFLEVTAPPCARTVPSTPTAVALSPAAAVGCGVSR
jgi:hypothetical protein